jgi:hypothetical protein
MPTQVGIAVCCREFIRQDKFVNFSGAVIMQKIFIRHCDKSIFKIGSWTTFQLPISNI